MIGMIAAVSDNGVIGQDNKIPFDYPADLKHFKETTLNSAIVMGRKTFESIGRPLPKRENIVLTSQELNVPGIKCMKSIADVLRHYDYIGSPPIWLIGGASIYQEGMEWADTIILTLTPDIIEGDSLVRFPWINPVKYEAGEVKVMESDTRLGLIEYTRRRYA